MKNIISIIFKDLYIYIKELYKKDLVGSLFFASSMIFIFLIALWLLSYGLINILNTINNFNTFDRVIFLGVVILIFSWIGVTLIESNYFEKYGINPIIKSCSKNNYRIFVVNIFNILLFFSLLFFLFSENKFLFFLMYLLYAFNELIFMVVFNSIADCVLLKVESEQFFSKKIVKTLKFYYLGYYRYVLVLLRIFIASFIVYLYTINEILSDNIKISLLFFISITLNEIIYWIIRIYVYHLLKDKTKGQNGSGDS